MQNNTVTLTSSLTAEADCHPVKELAEAWRVTIRFRDGVKTVLFGNTYSSLEYFVWVTGEYLEDVGKLNATMDDAIKFALQYIKHRFDETADDKGDNRDLGKIDDTSVACAFGTCQKNHQFDYSGNKLIIVKNI